MKKLKAFLAPLLLAIIMMPQTSQAQETKDPWLHFNRYPSVVTFMASTSRSYDENLNGVGSSSFVFTTAASLWRDRWYTSLSLLGPHRYHYIDDSTNVVLSTITADLGFGKKIPMSTSGFFEGIAVGIFGGVGTKNNAQQMPFRFGLTSQVNLNLFTFTDGWSGENSVGAFMRITYSAVSFKLDNRSLLSENEEIEFGLKISILKVQ